jgi:hypothetical protein
MTIMIDSVVEEEQRRDYSAPTFGSTTEYTITIDSFSPRIHGDK